MRPFSSVTSHIFTYEIQFEKRLLCDGISDNKWKKEAKKWAVWIQHGLIHIIALQIISVPNYEILPSHPKGNEAAFFC